MVNRWGRQLLDGLFPQLCLLCRLPSASHLPLCACCAAQLVENHTCCRCCALPLPDGDAGLCATCIQRPPALDRAIAPFLYEPHIGYIIARWKFQRERHLSGLLAELWLSAVEPPRDRDLLLPVPIHWRRLLGRGFNQAMLLAMALQDRDPNLQPLPLPSRVLCRTRAAPAQSTLTAHQRAHNLRGAFALRASVKGQRIAVIDDVMTTGATAEAIARLLKRAGAADVQLWCLARTPPPAT
ncbi:MAG TPA: amidophosphoribosyltransferase [Halieaceae bacterium]|nr:amidophosphoribosyltransferase [Halieaceae bacterium]